MSSESSLPIDSQKAKTVVEELMKTPEGRELADKIRNKLIDLNTQFKNLSPGDKQKFAEEFKGKFQETFEDLKESLRVQLGSDVTGESDDNSFSEEVPSNYGPQPNYFLFLIAFILILLLFGFFGYKLYLSIMEKELGKGKKNKKEEKKSKKLNSPPSSPRSKKEK